NAEIEIFCTKHFSGHKIQHNILLLVEELLQIVPLDKGATLLINFSEKTNEIELRIQLPASIGLVLGAEKKPDLISMSIINGLSRDFIEKIEGDHLILSMIVNNEK
ncbi:MAG: hypothetical protein RR550_02630, partial [Rikenellaceae bacterium]